MRILPDHDDRMSRPEAEKAYAAGPTLTTDIVDGFMTTNPDFSLTTQCNPQNCDHEGDWHQRLHTHSTRMVEYALAGWDAWQQACGPTLLDIHDWTGGLPTLREPRDHWGWGQSWYAAQDVDTASTGGDHVDALEQHFWIGANLIVVETMTDRHIARVHTITPQRPRWCVHGGHGPTAGIHQFRCATT